MTRGRAREQNSQLQDFAIEAARLMADLRCSEVRLLDVRGLSQVCDYVLIGSGTSERQMKSVAANLEELGREMSHVSFRSNRDDSTTWVIVDFVDLVAHLFEPTTREYYDLEALWSDSESIPWQRNGEGNSQTSPPSRS